MTDEAPPSRRRTLRNRLRDWCWYCGDGPTMQPARHWKTPSGRGLRPYIGQDLAFLDRRLACEFCRWFDEEETS